MHISIKMYEICTLPRFAVKSESMQKSTKIVNSWQGSKN